MYFPRRNVQFSRFKLSQTVGKEIKTESTMSLLQTVRISTSRSKYSQIYILHHVFNTRDVDATELLITSITIK
jgi:hypothetical protein